MNDVQTELEQLRAEVAQLKKALSDKQLPATPNLPSLHDDYDFVVTMTRFSEGLLSEKNVRKQYHLSEDTWTELASDERLIEAIEAEKVRRVRDGSFKREKAQQLVVKAPEVLDGIMMGKESAKHKIDAVKALDALADPGAQTARDDADRVIVSITLTADEKITFNKPIRPTPDDDKIIDVTPAPVPGFAITEG